MADAPKMLDRGLWGVLATPFSLPDLLLDEESLRREVALFKATAATGLVVLGVFGEAAALDSSEQAQVVRVVAVEGAGLPLVVGLSARSTAFAIEQARTAVEAAGENLAGLMVQVHTADVQVLTEHLTAIHRASGVGIVLQDYPVVSGVRISARQLLETVARCEFIVSIKSEAPPTAAVIAELTAATQVPVFGGLGGVCLLDELGAGAAGVMTGFSHPEGLRATLTAWDTGGFPHARETFAPWLPLVNFEAQPGIGLAVRKEVLRRRGIFETAAVRPPAPTFPAQLSPLLADHLNAVNERVGV